jgi:hypothetical protein
MGCSFLRRSTALLFSLEAKIRNQVGGELHLCQDIRRILSRRCMGNINKINSPIFNLKRNYGYDVDRNSGFYKSPWGKVIDSIIENSA